MKTNAVSSEVDLVINRHYNKKELCFLFGSITMYYLNRMIEETPDLEFHWGRKFSPREVLTIINHYGLSATFIKNQREYR